MQGRLIDPKTERDYYNDFIANSPKGHVLQSIEWGYVKKSWTPLYLVLEDQGEIKAAITILKRKIPGINKSIFYAPRGPVMDVEDEGLLDELLKEVKKIAIQHKAIFLKVDPDISVKTPGFRDLLLKKGFVSAEKKKGFEGVQPKFVFRLDVTPEEEELFKSFHSKTRYNVRLATRKGVTVESDCGEEQLKEFYRILLETCERDNFLVRPYSYFKDMWDLLVQKGMGKLFMAKHEGKYIAGTLALVFGDKVWYLYGASSNKYRNVMPNYLLQWTMIKWAQEKGCKIYDFRGVSGDLSEDNPLYGLYRFKKGFNGEFTEFIGEFDYRYSKFLYWGWHTFEPVYQKLVRIMIKLKKRGN